MLGIQINGEYLDLAPGTAAQIERVSPFFNSDDLAMERSLPFTFPYTPGNAKLLGLPNHFYTRRLKTKITGVRLYDNNNFCYTGDLILQSAELNVNDVTKSKITGFFLTGVSSFFQAVKDKMLKDLELGGVRSFAWTNSDPASNYKGFWQHAHDTLSGAHEYSFAPIRNEGWTGESEGEGAEWMNKLNGSGGLDYNDNFNTLAPQVSLKYLLEKIFTENGWELDHSGIQDQQWQTLFIPSFYAVSWQKVVETAEAPYFTRSPLSTVTINLQNHVPPELAITDFIIALRNRFNWAFDFDSSRKVCRLFPLKDLANGKKKDWTAYMDPRWNSDFSEDVKVFAFRNEIDGGDGLGSAPDFEKATFGEPVLNESERPAAAESNFNQVVYCWQENRYVQCRYDEDEGTYTWGLFGYGIYDYEPAGSNEDITTAASTMPVQRTLYRNNGVTDYYGLFPICEQEGNWEGKEGEFVPWGLRLMFHRGWVWEANPAGNKGQIQYPYLTSICFTPTQEEPDLAWSNVWKHELDGVDKGIINYWFRETLKYRTQSEVNTGVLNLPRQELVNHAWSDVILLRNVPFIMQDITDVIPFPGIVQVKVRRIG